MSHQRSGEHSLNNSPLAALYEREALTIFAYILRRVPTREDAEDILFEVFLAALEYEAIADLDSEKQRAWLLRVAHNKVVDYHRSTGRHSVVPLEGLTESLYSSPEMEPDQVLLQQEEYALMHTNLARLPALQQEIVHLRYMVGLPYAEIARLLNKREGAIRVLLSRSLHFLRNIYNRHEGGRN